MISDELNKTLAREVATDADSVIRAWGIALADIQAELINTLLKEKAISADVLQAMLDDLATRAYDQPPIFVPERLRRLLIPEIVETIRGKIRWELADL